MSFGSSILFFASTLVSSLKQRNIDMYGKENMIICNLGKETVSVLNDSELIGEYGLSYITGYACNDTSGTNNGVAIARLDDKGLDFASIKLLEGKYPDAAVSSSTIEAKIDTSTGVSPISSAFFNRSGVQKASYSRFMRRINLSADIFQ